MKKLVQLKNKENENLDPINFNYEKRISKLEDNSYSTEEKKVGTWINGKPIYRKVVEIPSLPNATTLIVPHGINNIETVTNFRGVFGNGSSFSCLPYTVATTGYFGYQISIDINQTNLIMMTETDRSNYSAFFILEYTKTTD